MTTYTRPAVTRPYDQIQADITDAVRAMAHNGGNGVEFWRQQTEHAQRLTNLWNEIVFQAVDDPALPRWTRFAALTTRDYYAELVRESRREEAYRAAQQEESTR